MWLSDNLLPAVKITFGGIKDYGIPIIKDVLGFIADMIEAIDKGVKKFKAFQETKNQQDRMINAIEQEAKGVMANPQQSMNEVLFGNPQAGALFNTTINAKTTVDAEEMNNILNVNNQKLSIALGVR